MITEEKVEMMLAKFNALEQSFAVSAVCCVIKIILEYDTDSEFELMENLNRVERDKMLREAEVTK